MISISCLESKLLNNNNWYGRFQLAPFQKGEGLTIANALRRTLLAEKSNFFITWVDFYNAEIPYSVLTGMRESIFDILLNLKQVIFTSDKILPNSRHFFKMPSNTNFRTRKGKFFKKKYDFESKIYFFKKASLNRTLNKVSNRTKLENQNFIIDKKINHEISKDFTNSLFLVNKQKNILKSSFNQSINMVLPITKKNEISKTLKYSCVHDLNFLNHEYLKTQNVFCQNQILGKTKNSENETFLLLPLKIFNKSTDLIKPFLDTSNSKKICNSIYIGYICAKGPATIYAKNIKLPKGLKCVDPDKYIATLADDGLFYLRFALTTEIKKLSLSNASNISISINQGIKFNTVKLNTLPKILFDREIQSCFNYRVDNLFKLNQEKKSKKLTQQYLNSNQLYDSKLWPVHYTKKLISEQRLVLTNDLIKQFNFQNTSITANIQKTCLLNIQIKHYYYKCGRFDRFLFDLIKAFKPNLKSTYYSNIFFKNKKNIFGQASSVISHPVFCRRQNIKSAKSWDESQNNDWRVLTRFQRTFERQKFNSQFLINYNLNNLKKPILENFLKKKQLIDKLSNISNPKGIIINSFSSKLSFQSLDKKILKDYLSNNKYFNSLVKWQKIFKSIKTGSIYDYLYKLHISEAIVTCFLITKPSTRFFFSPMAHRKTLAYATPTLKGKYGYGKGECLKNRISLLGSKLISNSACQAESQNVNIQASVSRLFFTLANKQVFRFLFRLSKQELTCLTINNECKHSRLWMSPLYEPYIDKFLNKCLSFQCFKNNILYFLKFYILQYNNSLDFLKKNSSHIKNTLNYPLFEYSSLFIDKLITTNSVQISTKLRAKPFNSIRQICYKPVFILSCPFQQNREKLLPLLNNNNLSDFRQVLTNKKSFLNSSYLKKKNLKITFNPIKNNSVVLKPIYLNVEQIIYILKQTTKFRKNQRINPVFFDSLIRLNNSHYPLNDSLIFSKRSNFFFSSFDKLDSSRFSFIYNKTQIPQQYIKSILSHVWILGNDFRFKNNFSYITLKSQSALQFKFIFHFNFIPLATNSNVEVFRLGYIFSKNLSLFIHYNIFTKQYNASNNEFEFWLTKLGFLSNLKNKRLVSKKNSMIKDSFFPLLSVDYKSNIKNLHKQPYNINIYHSKISFNLRYTYPLKYTIFETHLPFLNFSEKLWYPFKLNNLVQNFHSFLKNENFFEKKKDKNYYQATCNYKENKNVQVSNLKFIPCNFDFIQYNESFKIYTTLAYTCLKKHQTHLPKYHNFNRQNQKKYKNNDLKLISSQFFKSLIEDWTIFQKNNENWIFSTIYEKFSNKKPNDYPFLVFPDQLPSIFNNTQKWRMINNSNFNDAFIIIPCTWPLNFKLSRTPNLTNLFYSFISPLQKVFYVNQILKNTNENIFLNTFSKRREVIQNKLYWFNNINNKHRLLNKLNKQSYGTVVPTLYLKHGYLKGLGSYKRKNILAYEFEVNSKNYYKKDTYNYKKLSFLIPKFKVKKFFKKLVVNFEDIYYKNFLWNSRKITLRILNNAVLPLVVDRKYSISDFIVVKQQTRHPCLNILKTNVWSHKNFSNQFFKISNYQQKLPFYSLRHKTLRTTNYMCSKTYPNSINDNQTENLFRPNFSIKRPWPIQSQSANDYFSESFSSLHSKWKPFFTSFSAGPFLKCYQEKDFFIRSPFLDLETQRKKPNKNNQTDIVSSNQVMSSQASFETSRLEKLTSFDKSRWRLNQGSKSSNEAFKNNSKTKLPLISNLWSSSVFCSYSFYAISTKSDLLLQNLISFSNLNSSLSLPLEINDRQSPNNEIKDELVFSQPKNTKVNNTWIPNINEIKLSQKNLPTYKKNFEGQKTQTQYQQTNTNQFLNIKPFIKSFDKIIQKILKSQDQHNSTNHFTLNYYYHWQKAVHLAILDRFKKKFNYKKNKLKYNWYKNQHHDSFFLQYPKKNIDYANQSSINALKNKYLIRQFKDYERYFGNPLRRSISKKIEFSFSAGPFYNLILPIKLHKKLTTSKLKKANQHLKSWKSILSTAEANMYFCFIYPLFIQNCNLPWQKSKHIFCIPKHWFNRITISFKSPLQLTCFSYLSKTVNINTALNTNTPIDQRRKKNMSASTSVIPTLNQMSETLFSSFLSPVAYTQLSSSSNQTHQPLLHNKIFKNISLPVHHISIQNKGSYGIMSYFTIKESLNSIYKVNYIVESQAFESKPMSELAFFSDQNNRIFKPQIGRQNAHNIKFENIQRDSFTIDSLTVSNFLNGTYSFVPSKNIIINSFNEFINSQINNSQTKNENEYIQIDIWTNGELSPRQALLNAFRKLFELFYNLSKYNCLKPIEI